MKPLSLLLAAITVLVLPSPAPAQTEPPPLTPEAFAPPPRGIFLRAAGLYGQASIEYNEYDYYYYYPSYPLLDFDGEFDHTPGVSIALGWSDFEVEVLYFKSDNIDDSSNSLFDVDYADGDVSATTIMFNYTIEFPKYSPIRGYLGGGIGIGFYDYDLTQRDAAGTTTFDASDNDVGFGAQILGGVRFEVAPQLDLYVGGRAFWLIGDENVYVQYLALEFGIRIYF